MSDRTRAIRRASAVGIGANALLAAVKATAGFATGSWALLADAIDSGLDALTSGVTFAAARLMAKPPDPEHPWGHHRAETLATVFLAFMILFAGLQLAIASVRQVVTGAPRPVPGELAAAVAALSAVAKLALALYKRRVGRRIASPALIAAAQNMGADIFVSVGVIAGVIAAGVTGLVTLDSIAALLVSGWIGVVAVRILWRSAGELMEGHGDRETYRALFEAVGAVPDASRPHRARIKRIGAHLVVDLDIEVDPTLTVAEAHEISHRTERAIRVRLPEVYDVVVHIEPRGNVEDRERYGVHPGAVDAAPDHDAPPSS